MKRFKIAVVGNSVALRCRPQRAGSLNYGQYLEQLLNEKYADCLHMVENLAFSRATVLDIKCNMHQLILNRFPDVYVINLGVCDAATREIPYWYAEVINRKRDSLFRHLLSYVHDHFIIKHRPFFVKLRGKRTWVKPKKFEKTLSELFDEIKRNSNSFIITLPINLANDRVEQSIPGSSQKYKEYNLIIKKVAEAHKAAFIDLADLASETHYPDGTHFSDAGNQLVAERILEVIEKNGLLQKKKNPSL